MSNQRIDVKRLRDGWYEGTIGDCRFQAKVYDTGSKFGINKGRISKLEVWDRTAGLAVRHISYERGWNIKPATDEYWALLWDLLECLEALPVSEV